MLEWVGLCPSAFCVESLVWAVRVIGPSPDFAPTGVYMGRYAWYR